MNRCLIIAIAGALLFAQVITAQGAESFTVPIDSFVPVGTANDPLPDARAAAMTFSGISLGPGDSVDCSVTDTASGGPGFQYFDANGAPAGSQAFSGPRSDGEFPNIVGTSANIYSVVATINSDRDATLSGGGDQWFLVGTHRTFVADRVGELVFIFHDAIYRNSWAPAYEDNTGTFTATCILTRKIDIKPGSLPNSINRFSSGKIPVAILSSANFNAPAQVNTASLTFGRTGDEASLAFCSPSPEDVNADGQLDLICHFTTQMTGFQSEDRVGVLKGQTVSGSPINGSDSVRIVP